MSQDRSGRQRSVDEQHEDNQRAAAAHGMALGEPYREKNGVSASRYSSKTRDAFGQLLADLETGAFGAEVLMLWESSRGSRRVGEWLTLIELCEECGVKVFVTTHSRLYDPANPRDRRSLLEDAIDSEYESNKMSARSARAAAAGAAAGRPHGRCPYGYQRVLDPRTGRLATWEPDPVEAPVVVELFERIKRGHSLRGVAKDFDGRGIVNRSGRPFTAPHLRDMLRKVLYTGRRTHRGEVLDGTWPPLVSEEIFFAVRRIISNPDRKTTRHGRAVHELSMIIRCDVCGGPLAVTTRTDRPGGGPRYQCQFRGCVKIDKAGVDEVVIGVIHAYLSRPDVFEELSASPEDSAEAERVAGELAQLRAQLAEAELEVPASIAEAKTMAQLREGLAARITAAETRQRELTVPAELLSLIEPGGHVAERWRDAPVAARRRAAQILLSPEILGEVRISRSPVPGHRVDAIDRIVWRRQSER